MGKRGPAPRVQDGESVTLRVGKLDLEALERVMPAANRADRIRHCIRWWLDTHALDYAEAALSDLEDELSRRRQLVRRLKELGIRIDDSFVVKLRRRVEQTKLHGVTESQQRSWLDAQKIPREEHDRYIQLMQELTAP